MTRWNIGKILPRPEFGRALHPVTAELLSRRGISSAEGAEAFLFPSYERDILDPFLFSDMNKVVDRVERAKRDNERIAVYGDYDADGVTGAAILREALGMVGMEPEVYIPHKVTEGYGLNSEAIRELVSRKITLIITVDCGISNHSEIAEARDQGVDVIVVDHHHVPAQVPDALAIINPRHEASGYPFKELAGVGVAFKVAQAIVSKITPRKKEMLKWLLDLAAIGTIADCVSLLGENRVLAKYGMIVLSKTRRIGLREMYSVARLAIDEDCIPTSWNVSFQIAPRINAAGRIDHANTAYYLLTEKDQVRARSLALEVEAKNQERQRMTTVVTDEIRKIAGRMFPDKSFIFAVGEHYPLGIVGLVAGKIAQEFNRPAAVFQCQEHESKGSFRSIPGINIIELIEQCADTTMKFGGHSQAAGITVPNEKLEPFLERLGTLISRKAEGLETASGLEIDVEIPVDDIDLQLAQEISKFEPFGEGNPEPVFATRGLIVDSVSYVGNGEKHLKLWLRGNNDSPKVFEAIGFNFAKKLENITRGDILDVAYNLTQDRWNGNSKIVLRLIDIVRP